MSDWKDKLKKIIQERESDKKHEKEGQKEAEAKARTFFSDTVKPAFEDVKVELEKHGKRVNLIIDETYANIVVFQRDRPELDLSIMVRIHPFKAAPFLKKRYESGSTGEGGLTPKGEGGRVFDDVVDVTKQDIIDIVIRDYEHI